MVSLTDIGGYWALIGISALFGGVGGVAAELLRSVRGRSGVLRPPRRISGAPRGIELGTLGSVLLGAIAAVAALWIFPPLTTVVVRASGGSTSTSTYDLIKLVALSLIVGSAGAAVLSALQARVNAQIIQANADASTKVAQAQIATLQTESSSQPPNEPMNLSSALNTAKAAIDALSEARERTEA